MKNITRYIETFCGACVHGNCHCGCVSCDSCRDRNGGVCPCNEPVENENKPCKYFELNIPNGKIFENIKCGFKAYLIGKYGTEKEKHDYELNLSYADDNMDISNPPKRYEIEGILKHMLCKIMYEMGDFENEN